MASKIGAINAYRPRIKKGKIVELDEAATLLAKRSGKKKLDRREKPISRSG